MDRIKEWCYECGRSVRADSVNGLFVNRIPSLDSRDERIDMGVPYPSGNFLCAECDERIRDEIS